MKINTKANKEIELLYQEDLNWCEMCLAGYGNPNPNPHQHMSTAHRHKKAFYYGKPDELLWSYYQTMRLCQFHHTEIEYSRERTEEAFKYFRGEEVDEDGNYKTNREEAINLG